MRTGPCPPENSARKGSVNLFDFHFRFDVAVIEEVYVHFRYAIFEGNHGNDVVQRQQTVALDLRVDAAGPGNVRDLRDFRVHNDRQLERLRRAEDSDCFLFQEIGNGRKWKWWK